MTFRIELTISTPKSKSLSASKLPTARYHLLHIPPSGGAPMMHKLPRANAIIVSGIFLPRPFNWLISVLCAATMIAPAQKNKVILPKACMTMCMPPPITPHTLASMAPSSICCPNWHAL